MRSEDLKLQILIGEEIASLWFNHNDQETYNSMESTLKFLKKAAKKAKKEGYKNIRVAPTYTEGDENNLEQYYVKVIGDKAETKKEFKARIRSLLAREKMSREDVERSYKYYQSKESKEMIEYLEELSK